MFNVSLAWERCPDGVRLVDPIDYGPTYVCARSERREPVHLDIINLENPAVLRFINARNDEALLGFLSRFGLINREESAVITDYPAEMEVFDNVKQQRVNYSNILDGLYTAQSSDEPRRFDIDVDVSVSLAFGTKDAKPNATLKARSLADFMLLELAAIAAAGAKPSLCHHCRTVFITGPLTGRRSTATFCSDRCRVAAMRRRKAASE